MDTIKTNTGKVFESDYIVSSNATNRIYLRVFTDLLTASSVFSDTDETSAIMIGDTRLEGYTRLAFLSIENDAIKVCLAKE